jgi:hypothetical protein
MVKLADSDSCRGFGLSSYRISVTTQSSILQNNQSIKMPSFFSYQNILIWVPVTAVLHAGAEVLPLALARQAALVPAVELAPPRPHLLNPFLTHCTEEVKTNAASLQELGRP